MLRSASTLALFCFLAATSSVSACEKYFVIVFGSQTVPPDPHYSHSFAVFIKASGPPENTTICYHTISWLSLDGHFRLRKLLPQPGRNWELHETIRFALAHDERVSAWGPYEIQPKLYFKAIRQLQKFERWNTKFKAADSGWPTFLASNCIHAISGVSGSDRLRVASPSWGETASWFVTRRYKRYFVDSTNKHCWLIPCLGLDRYPIVYRDLRPPRTGAIWTRIKKLTGRPVEY